MPMNRFVMLISLLIACGMQAHANADSAQYYFNKATEEKDGRLYSQAAKNLDKAIQFDASFTQAYLENARVHLLMSRLYEAGKYLEKAFQLQPNDTDVRMELAVFSFNSRQYAKVIELMENCAACAASDRLMGMSYYHTEDYGKAEKYLQSAVKKNAQDAEAFYTLGRTFLELEKDKEAIDAYKKAASVDAAKSQWMYELGLLYYNRNEYKNAVECFERAAGAGYPRGNDFLENYGFAQIFSGNSQPGLQTLSSVLSKKPNNRELLNNIAYALYSTKQYESALSYYEKLLTLNEKDASSLYMAGMTFQKMGQKEKGQAICDRAIQLDPSLARHRQKKELPFGL